MLQHTDRFGDFSEDKFSLPKALRLKYISTLKDTQVQAVGGLTAGRNGLCAVAVLAKVMGLPLDGNCYRKVINEYGQPLVTKLFRLNDADKLSLKQIGTWVEKNVESY